MTKTTILMTSIIAMTFILLVTTSYAYAAVDNFYWSEEGLGGVFTADAAGQNVAAVSSGPFVRIDDVEYDPLADKVWWNNWIPGGANSSPLEGIYSANADGTGQVQVTGSATLPFSGQFSTTNGEASGLTGIVLDPANSQLFFTRGVSYAQGFPPIAGSEVSKVNMDGSGYTLLTTVNDAWHADGIELDTTTLPLPTLLFGEPGIILGFASGPVNCMDTSGGSKVFGGIAHTTGHGRSLALDAANGLLFYSSHGVTGVPGRSSGGGIFVTSPCPAAAPINVLNDPNTGIPDIELDTVSMRIYWTDYARGEIRSADYDASGTLSNIATEVSNLINPYGLALDLEISVEIDIKPGSDPSSVNCKNNKGNVPVAIFGADNFDVSTIDLGSLELNGVPVTEAHNKLHIDDINNDGFDDAVLHLDKAGVCEATSDNSDYPLKASADATLTGSNADGDFEGIGDIRIVKR